MFRPRPWLSSTLTRAAGYFLGYAAWVVGFRLLVLTLITWVLSSSNARFQEISDAFGANEVTVFGIGSLLYIGFLRALNPLTSVAFDEFFTPHRFERRFVPGFIFGAVLASSVVLAFMLSGLYHYFGVYVQLEDATMTAANVLIRVAALGCLAYCEEFLFRHKIMNHLRRGLPDLSAAAATALLYCAIKALQFDLGWMQTLTLFLLSLALSVRTITDGDFLRGAGMWAGMLIVFQPLLSLPVLGNEYQGVLMVKDEGASRFLTGGAGGPLSSFGLQLLLLIDVAKGILRHRGILLKGRVHPLR